MFATKPALAQYMITDAPAGGAQAAWAAGDEVYGADSKLRKHVRKADLGYVPAIAKDHQIITGIGARRAADLTVHLPSTSGSGCLPGADSRVNAGTTGVWSRPPTKPPTRPRPAPAGTTGCRSDATARPGSTRSTACSPTLVPFKALFRVASRRWTIEESFAASKELAALDEHQVGTWTSWHRWTALAILAHVILSVMVATEPAPATNHTLIAPTRNEIRRLLAAAIAPTQTAEHVVQWSTWRRQHQARISHYTHRAAHGD